MRSEVERLLIEDCIEKKKAARGIYNRASRLGYIKGGVKTQYDFMDRKEKKLLNGDVKVYNLYENLDNIPTFESLKSMDKEKAKSILMTAREHHSQVEISKKLGVSQSSISLLCKILGIPPNKTNKKENSVKLRYKNISKFPTLEKILSFKSDSVKARVVNYGYEQFTDKEISRHWGIEEKALKNILMFNKLPLRDIEEKVKDEFVYTENMEKKQSSEMCINIDDRNITGSELAQVLSGLAHMSINDKTYSIKIIIEKNQ